MIRGDRVVLTSLLGLPLCFFVQAVEECSSRSAEVKRNCLHRLQEKLKTSSSSYLLSTIKLSYNKIK